MKNENNGKRIASVILAAALLLGCVPAVFLLPAAATAVAADIAAPEHLEYLWNGTCIDDRSSFSIDLNDWLLATTQSYCAKIISASSGTGVRCNREMADCWLTKSTVALPENSTAALGFTAGSNTLSVQMTKTADGTELTLLYNGTAVAQLGTAPEEATQFTVIADNTREAQELRLHITTDTDYRSDKAITEMSAAIKEVLTATDGLTFSATAADTVFSELCANDLKYPFASDAESLAFLEDTLREVLPQTVETVNDGRQVYVPDASGNYQAVWVFDPAMSGYYGGDLMDLEILKNTADFSMENIREDGWIPNHVGFNGQLAMSAGDFTGQIAPAQLDTAQCAAMALDSVLRLMPEEDRLAYFEKWEGTVMKALSLLPTDENGLIYNDPAIRYSTYGNIDAVAVTGSVADVSAMAWKAYTIMAYWQDLFGKDSTIAHTEAARIEAAFEDTFYDGETGLIRAATIGCAQPSVMTSAYASWLGFPFSQKAKDSIAAYFIAHYDEITQFGAIRHLPGGEYWEDLLAGLDRDTYMQGAYWPVYAAWFISAIEDYSPELVRRTVDLSLAYGYRYGFYECRNGSYRKLQNFTNAIINLLPTARKLYSTSAEQVEVSGETTLKTGMTAEYSVNVLPQEATVRSVSWTVNGKHVKIADTLTYAFREPGTYLIEAEVTDTAMCTLTASTTVTVTDFDTASVTLTYPQITATAGETVCIPISAAAGSNLTNADLCVSYDAAVLCPIADGDEDYAVKGKLLQDALLVSNRENSQLKLAFAAKDGIAEAGELFVMQFEALTDLADLSALSFAVTNCRVAAVYGGVTAPAAATVTQAQAADPCEGYTDINREGWYHTAADFVIAAGIMGSTKTDALTFEPNTKVSRAMVASILYRMADGPAVSYKATFTDVPDGKWFTNAIEWCAQNGLASGKGNGRFDPNGNVTRQEFAVFMKKMAEYLEKDTSGQADLTAFADADKVPAWAKTYVQWAVSAGLISGKTANGKTYLAPTDNATRAEVASILMRFFQTVVSE